MANTHEDGECLSKSKEDPPKKNYSKVDLNDEIQSEKADLGGISEKMKILLSRDTPLGKN